METKLERAAVCFGIGPQSRPIVIEVRPHHDTVSALRGVQVGFELLNGITLAQARKLLDAMNENVIGVTVTTSWDDRAGASAACEVATGL
jgi:hypothetical protein